MQFKLRMIHGVLKKADGTIVGTDIEIPAHRFVIGTAQDCHMRCSGNSIDPHHCVILFERDRVVVRDEGSRGGTFVNGLAIDKTACLFHGDRLRLGRMEFDIVTGLGEFLADDLEAPPVLSSQNETVDHVTDTVADLVVTLLIDADEEDRARRRFDPSAREFRLPPNSSISRPESTKTDSRVTKPPLRRPPSRLPSPPEISGQDTVDAAHKALIQLLNPPKRKP